MASGIKVHDDCLKVFNEMKVRKSSSADDVKKRKKIAFFKISECGKFIVVDEEKQVLVGDIGDTVDDPFNTFVKLLPEKDCCYALYDISYETCESRKEELMFIFWAPENANIKKKMVYASSTNNLRAAFTGVKHVWQVNGLEDISRSAIIDKLGVQVKSLEGKKV
ncbi:cofilin-2-like [Petromyzon marinus]|uniref:Cofilin-2-like n=1 Tax=Petromyzon marinus TaxID=7757 RepID=A0AAJ7X4I7_PETMA|nr:cofilin-2-like [Petromyzon marinus]